MLYELKQKIMNSRWGEQFARWLEKTPMFPICYRLVWMMGAADPRLGPCGVTKEESKKYFEENKDKIHQVVSLLADKKSKKMFLASIKDRMSGFFPPLGSYHDQYFPKGIIHLSDDEVFVDCGTYIGDTIAKFREMTNDHYKKIVAFEPDPICRQKILDQKIARCEVLPYGVWDHKETQTFCANGKGSSIVEDLAQGKENLVQGTEKITIFLEKIDDLKQCADMTFLKMDIENAELNALKGAEQTIRRQRPKMAICIYHSNQHMLEIPLWIASLNMGYTLYVRHHSSGVMDSVLYAV